MTPEQQVIYRQLQLAGLGLVILLFGVFSHTTRFVWIGLGFMIFGLLRTLFIYKVLKKGKEPD